MVLIGWLAGLLGMMGKAAGAAGMASKVAGAAGAAGKGAGLLSGMAGAPVQGAASSVPAAGPAAQAPMAGMAPMGGKVPPPQGVSPGTAPIQTTQAKPAPTWAERAKSGYEKLQEYREMQDNLKMNEPRDERTDQLRAARPSPLAMGTPAPSNPWLDMLRSYQRMGGIRPGRRA